MSNEITISIVCITFNHGRYIRQTLEGFLSQTLPDKYKYEILIHDDASTDDTIGILKDYAARYRDVFTLFLEEENQYGKGRSYFLELFRKARGKYIAICEGDDFWTDPTKLSQQIEALEQHPECVACCHNEVVVKKDGTPWPDSYQKIYRQDRDIILDSAFLYDHNKFSHTASMVVRASLFQNLTEAMVEDFLSTKANGDMKWAAMAAACGKVFFIAKDMACYRFVPAGGDSWSAKNAGKNICLSTYEQLERLQGLISRFYDVEIDYGGSMDRLWQTAVLTWLKKPSKSNYSILKKISQKQNKNVLHMVTILGSRVMKKLCRSSK
ncbi:MAG: glycosyltransferase [Oscillospiraceae bacterium]|nr:glycosyltransferase [Oscillospiraceae bacterium]